MPRNRPQGREGGGEEEVAVPLLPRRERVARRGVHVDVDREQVVARLRAMRDDVVDEVLSVEALALQTAVHVDDREHDGVDRARRNGTPQVVDRLELHHGHAPCSYLRYSGPIGSGPTNVTRSVVISSSV